MREKKKLISITSIALLILGILILSIMKQENSGSVGIGNPSAVYCKKLGYRYVIENTPEGQRGICIFDGEK
ncbi:MAG TPA: DUF333 domain-containing protein, partial [Thermococcus sp.]|nr:DUF333 domain-containing protein [Thermococcus sp.]